MSSEKSDAIVIRQADFSETSRVVTFFTRDFGKISTVAKGARRLKGPFDAALDLLTHCRIVFIRKSSSSLDILTEAQVKQRFRPTGTNLNALYGGYYVAELLGSLTEEYDPHIVLFDEAVACLGRLQEGSHPQEAVVRFELAVLREIGQLPSFDVCMACGNPLTGHGPFAYWVSQGGMICAACRKQEYQQQAIQPETVQALRNLSHSDDAPESPLVIPPRQLAEIRRITASAISHVLGHRPKMYRYLNPR